VVTPCWIQLRLKVDHGAIGIAAFNDNTGIVSRTNSVVMKSEEPMDVVLKVASLRTANYVIIFNETGLASQVEVLDAAVLVTQQDWDLHKAVLASVR
jgi:N-acyl-D-aspartate/D-glutamate deacylase